MKKPWWAKKNEEKWEQLVFNYNLLKKIEKEKGNLQCEYCGLNNLKIYRWDEKVNNEDVATVDHFLPKSQYPELSKVRTNLLVACHSCNNKKGDNIPWNHFKYQPSDIKFKMIK